MPSEGAGGLVNGGRVVKGGITSEKRKPGMLREAHLKAEAKEEPHKSPAWDSVSLHAALKVSFIFSYITPHFLCTGGPRQSRRTPNFMSLFLLEMVNTNH